MVKIPIINFLKECAINGDESKRLELMQRVLNAIKSANFEDTDIKEFLITAFEDICAGKDAKKSLLLKGHISGKSVRQDYSRIINIGQEIYDCRNTLILGKTKNRPKKTPLAKCLEAACLKYGIAHDTANDYYKEFKKYQKMISKIEY